MASSSHSLRVGIQILLAVVIVGLSYWLYVSITKPWEAVEKREEMTRLTRARMDNIRTALIHYERKNRRFPLTLDSIQVYIRQDSLLSLKTDSIFGIGFQVDSLLYSPRTGKAFEYAVNDTARVKTYLLKDPDTDDQIGTLAPDPTRLNAASWE